MTNNFVTSEKDAPNGCEPLVENLNQINTSRPIAQEVEQEKQISGKAVQSLPTLGIDWGERGVLNNANRGFTLLR